MKFTLPGTPPAGCETLLPSIFGDNWRMDGYSDRAVYMKSDLMLYPQDGGDPDPGHAVLGKGTLSEAPQDGICTIPDVTQMRSDTDPLGTGEAELAYHAHDMRFSVGRATRARPSRRRSTSPSGAAPRPMTSRR